MKLASVVIAAALVAVSSAWAQERAAQPAPPIVGIWKLNSEKSRISTPANYTEIRQYSQRTDGFMVGLLITGNPQVGYHYLQFVAKSDGKDYPEYSDVIVGDLVAADKPTRRTYSETLVDEYTIDWTDKVDGRVTAHGKKIVSTDRKTLTITVDGSSTVRIYDRQ
jgi:hypothetical protein